MTKKSNDTTTKDYLIDQYLNKITPATEKIIEKACGKKYLKTKESLVACILKLAHKIEKIS